MAEKTLLARVREDEENPGLLLVTSPVVGLADGGPRTEVFLNSLDRVVSIKILGERYSLRLPRGHHGRVIEVCIPDELTPVDFDQPLVRLDPRAFDNPVLSMFEGLRRTPLSSALVSRFYEVAVEPGDDNSSVICRYNVGPPAILEKRYGAGRCLLFTTTCSAEWTNLPKKPIFLPLIHESIYYLAGSSESRRNILVGEPFRRLLRPDEYAARFSLRRRSPGLREGARDRGGEGEVVSLAGTPRGGNFVLRYEDTNRAGIYELERQEGEAVEYFCVNVPAEESDVQRVEVEVIRRALPGFTFTYARDESGLGLAGERSVDQRELWKVLLWSVLILVCLESVLAHRFGK